MHNVSTYWEDNQESQLRKKTLVELNVFNLGIIPSKITWSGVAGTINCVDLFAFEDLQDQDSITFEFDDTFSFNGGDIECESRGNGEPTILIYDNFDTLLDSGEIPDVKARATTYNNVYKIVIENDQTQSEIDIVYLSLFGSVKLVNNDIEKMTYQAHCDVLNKDLPYHKVNFTTIQKSFPVGERVVGYFKIGYHTNYDEYIPLGCGYYYLDKQDGYKNDGFRQQYKFIDIISTLTQKYRFNNTTNYDYQSLVSRILISPTQYIKSYVPNFDNSNLSTQPTMNIEWSSVYEHTIAEVLQLVAQASGLVLYVDEKNIIKFKAIQANQAYIITDTNDMWLLDKPITDELDKVKTLIVNGCKCEKEFGSGGSSVNVGQFTTVSGQTRYYVELEGIYTGLGISSGTALYTSNNYIVIQHTTPNTTVNINAGYRWTTPKPKSSQQYSVLANGEFDYTLNLELAYFPLYTDVSNHYVGWLRKNKQHTLSIRLDPKYYVLDKLNSGFKEYGDFVIEDISAVFQNGYKGTFKGRIIEERLQAPIVYVYSDRIEVVNPNGVEVEWQSYDETSMMSSYTLSPNETKIIYYTDDANLYYAYQNWVSLGITQYSCYFNDRNLEQDYLDSKSVKIFGGN